MVSDGFDDNKKNVKEVYRRLIVLNIIPATHPRPVTVTDWSEDESSRVDDNAADSDAPPSEDEEESGEKQQEERPMELEEPSPKVLSEFLFLSSLTGFFFLFVL